MIETLSHRWIRSCRTLQMRLSHTWLSTMSTRKSCELTSPMTKPSWTSSNATPTQAAQAYAPFFLSAISAVFGLRYSRANLAIQARPLSMGHAALRLK